MTVTANPGNIGLIDLGNAAGDTTFITFNSSDGNGASTLFSVLVDSNGKYF